MEAVVECRPLTRLSRYKPPTVNNKQNFIESSSSVPQPSSHKARRLALSSLYPLQAGNHTLHFIGTLGSPTVTPTLTSTNPRFATEVTYHLTVK